MKLYIDAYSSFRGKVDDINLKKELKQKYKLDTRRQDTFIHLAVYGAQRLKERVDIESCDELYITSGAGNIDVLQKTNNYVCEEKEFIKPFDFINMLGNTTSYYVATSLGLKDKNIFQISNKFTFINTLVSVYASLKNSKKNAIVGAIDLVTEPDEVIKRVLGVAQETSVTSSVTYQKFSLSKQNAIGEVEFDTQSYSLEEIQSQVHQSTYDIMASMRCKALDAVKDDEFFETMPSYYIAYAMETKKNILYVDCFDGVYKIIKIRSLV